MDGRSILLVALLAMGAAAEHGSATPPAVGPSRPGLPNAGDLAETRIARLIEQLGDDRFFARQQAEKELLAIGHDAFDQLKAAEDYPDPEVAARARYLARQLAIEWTQSDDPALVKQLMNGYDSLDEEDRKTVVNGLVTRAKGESIPALCRIVRFDDSDFISCYAALAISRGTGTDQAAIAEQREQISAGIGRSQRTGARWLQTYLDELTDPESALRGWRYHATQQRTVSNQKAIELTIGLLRQQADVLDRLDRDAEMLSTWFEMLSLDPNDERSLLRELVVRLIDEQRFEAIDRVIVEFRDRFRSNPELLYLVAEAHLDHGNDEKARQIADVALALAIDPRLRLQVAARLMRRGRSEWSEREFREIIAKLPVTQFEAIYAHSLLASLYYDHERYQDAADVFAELLTEASNGKKVEQAPDVVTEFDLKHFSARRAYYTACHHRSLGDHAKEREYLDKAIAYDPADIDVLIAMFALPGVDDTYQQQTRTRIDTAAKALDRQVRRNPEKAVGYNNWAWLVANTFGDFGLAVERAQHAVELADEESLAGHLDTLARCHFANDDLESALRQQEKAISLDPHTRQLQRQLKMFKEAAAAAKK